MADEPAAESEAPKVAHPTMEYAAEPLAVSTLNFSPSLSLFFLNNPAPTTTSSAAPGARPALSLYGFNWFTLPHANPNDGALALPMSLLVLGSMPCA